MLDFFKYVLLAVPLKGCKTGGAVDALFDAHHITDLNKRMACLKHCMGSPEIFFAGPSKADPDEDLHSRYATLRAMFITGTWRCR